MRYIDVVNLRDGLTVQVMIKGYSEEEAIAMAERLRVAFKEADELLYNDQLPILVDPEGAKLIRQHFNENIPISMDNTAGTGAETPA